MSAIHYGNGTSQRISFDQRYRPLSLEIRDRWDRKILERTQRYDAGSNPIQIMDEICLDAGECKSTRQEFQYDDLERLISVEDSQPDRGVAESKSGLRFAYDAVGNIVFKGRVHDMPAPFNRSTEDLGRITYDSANGPHLPRATESGLSFGYDLRGNRTEGPGALLVGR